MTSTNKMWLSHSGRRWGKSRLMKELEEQRRELMTKVTITYEQLDSKDACEGQLKLFKKTFPNGISVTSEEELVAIAKKFSKKFDMFWASENLLSVASCDRPVTIKFCGNYIETTRPARDKDEEVEKQSYDNLEEAIATSLAKSYYEQESTKGENL